MTIEIEKNVPFLPLGEGKRSKYPWSKMEVGDSILVKDIPSSSLLSAAKSWAMRNNSSAKFSTRQESDGVRIWRVE